MEEEKKDQRDVLIGPGTDDADLGTGKSDNNGHDATTVSQLTQTNDKEEEKENQRDVLIGPETDDAGLGTGKSDNNGRDTTTKSATENDGTDIHPDDSLHPIHDDRPNESPAGEEKNIGNGIGQGCAIILSPVFGSILGVAIVIIMFVFRGLIHTPKIDNNDKSDSIEERIKTYQDDDIDTTVVYVGGIDSFAVDIDE